MQPSPRRSDAQAVDGAEASRARLAPYTLQMFSGARGCNIGQLSVNIQAGRDVVIQHITSYPGLLDLDNSDMIQGRRGIILDCLKGPQYHSLYIGALEQRMAQTGLWFIKSPYFQNFVCSKGVTLWCTGMPGAGKTILASVAIEYLREMTKGAPRMAIAFAFLRYSERHTFKEIITSILAQLIKDNDLACGTFWSHYSHAAEASPFLFDITESGLETALRDIVSNLEKVYVAIDGLDEAPDEVKDRLLEALVPSGVNLLVLSRPLDLYTDLAPDAFCVSIQAKTKDIEIFVRGEVQRSSRLRSIFRGKEERISELCKKVARQSDGMFLVARLQMEAIMRSSTSLSKLFRNLEALPKGLDGIYDHTLRRIRDSEDSSIAFRALAWIAHHADTHPLTPPFLQRVLSFNADTRSFDDEDLTPLSLILTACRGLVAQPSTTSQSREEVRFIHYTAYEYIKIAKLDMGGLSNPHSLLTLTCLACMEDHHQYMLDLVEDAKFSEIRRYAHSKPLVAYSYRNWRGHAKLSRAHGSSCSYVRLFSTKHKERALCMPDPPTDIPSMGPYACTIEVLGGVNLAILSDLSAEGTFTFQNTGSLPNIVSRLNGYTPFHLSAILGRFDIFQTMLSSFTGANLLSKDGRSVLHVAVEYGQTSFIQQLRDFWQILGDECTPGALGFHINGQDRSGQTPLMFAIMAKQTTIAQLLSSCNGADLNIQDNTKRSALHHCVNATSDLSGDGLDTKIRQWDALSAMMCSIPHTNINLRDKEGTNAFMLACVSGFMETAECILARYDGKPPLVCQTNDRGQTALMIMCRGDGYGIRGGVAFAELLVAQGSDLHARDLDGMTPFLYAVGALAEWRDPCGSLWLVERLFSVDPTVIDHRDYRGRTALIIAAQGRADHESLVPWILNSKGHCMGYINAQDNDGKTALFYACRGGCTNVLAALLSSHGTDIDYPQKHGFPIIHDWLSQAYRDGTHCHKWQSLSVLMKAREWDPVLARRVFTRALSEEAVNWRPGRNCMGVLAMVKDAFIWNIEEIDTVVLLASASLKTCRALVVLVLVSIGLLPLSSFDFKQDGTAVCGSSCTPNPFSQSDPHTSLVSAARKYCLGEDPADVKGERWWNNH